MDECLQGTCLRRVEFSPTPFSGVFWRLLWLFCGVLSFHRALAGEFAPCRVALVPGAYTANGWTRRLLKSGEYWGYARKFFESSGRGCEVKQIDLPPDATLEVRALWLREQLSGKSEWLVLAHSMGGLDARLALERYEELRSRIRGVVTIGTPHRGAVLANWLVEQAENGGFWYWALRFPWGYDLRELSFLKELTPSFVQTRLSPRSNWVASFASARGEATPKGALLFRAVEKFTGLPVYTQGDGLVLSQEQRFGKDLGAFQLDHLGEIAAGHEISTSIGAGKSRESVGLEQTRFLETVWMHWKSEFHFPDHAKGR